MAIEIKGVSKIYKDTLALNEINLKLEKNKIYGLLGRNGAGKSTLLNIMANRDKSSQGDVLIDGENVWENDEVQKNIYLMSEKWLYPGAMTGEKALKWSREFYPQFDIEYAKKLAKLFDLNLRKRFSGYSTGYASIVKLIIALSVNTPYVFFDEPVLGLDANHRLLFYQKLIEKYSENPFTIIISTHLIEEIAQMIEEIIIIDRGEIICNDTYEDLMNQGFTVSGPAGKVDEYVKDLNQIGYDTLGGLKTVTVLGKNDFSTVPDGIEIGKIDLQKLFIKLTETKGEKLWS